MANITMKENQKAARRFLEPRAPTAEESAQQQAKLKKIREGTIDFLAVILSNCRPGKDRDEAILLARKAKLLADESVLLNGAEL